MVGERRYQLLVFDWDGTLMDSVAAIVACMKRASGELGLEPLCEETVRRTIGLGLEDTKAALGIAGEEELWRQVVERYRHHWFNTYRHRGMLFSGAVDTLEALDRQGYLLAVATGKSRRGLDRDLEATGLTSLFHATRTADESFSKPHPGMLLELFEELGVDGREALMVGDTTFDLEMAGNAGSRAVAVLSGSHRREELERLSPLACLADVTELTEWLGRRAVPAPRGAAAET